MTGERHTVTSSQDLIDITLQMFGTLEGLPALLRSGQLPEGLNTALTVGQQLVQPAYTPATDDHRSAAIAAQFFQRRQQIGTAAAADPPLEGISIWAIHDDFVLTP